MKQEDYFIQSEADQWYLRNKCQSVIPKSKDVILGMIGGLPINSHSRVLDVGCADGHRLQMINDAFGAQGFGIDPSKLAVQDGSKTYPKLDLKVGTIESLPYEDEFFDCIVCNSVLHWVDRSNLFKSISEMDRVVKKNGYIIIGDFYPASNTKVEYHHLKGANVFTYKQAYFDVFRASGLYSLIEMKLYSDSQPTELVETDFHNRRVYCVLKKDGSNLYRV